MQNIKLLSSVTWPSTSRAGGGRSQRWQTRENRQAPGVSHHPENLNFRYRITVKNLKTQ
jgi:hypothetical protein